MSKITTPGPGSAQLSATEIARRAARTEFDIGTPGGFAEQGNDPKTLVPAPGGANVIVPGVKIKAFPSEIRVTLPRRLEADPTSRSAQVMAELAQTIASPLDLGRMVRRARERRDLSQQEFADLAGVGRRFLSELENGKPTLELGKVLKVANAAGIVLFARER